MPFPGAALKELTLPLIANYGVDDALYQVQWSQYLLMLTRDASQKTKSGCRVPVAVTQMESGNFRHMLQEKESTAWIVRSTGKGNPFSVLKHPFEFLPDEVMLNPQPLPPKELQREIGGYLVMLAEATSQEGVAKELGNIGYELMR